jgi:cob(I)alamin adenosyltransferase
MGKRLTRIYTRTGDDGCTGMADGSRVAKDSAVIQAIGDVDELNACIGLVLTHPLPDEVGQVLIDIQHRLFDLGGELSYPPYSKIDAEKVRWLETCLDKFNEPLPPLEEFVLPGGTPAAAACHLARAVCRRAERRLVSLQRKSPGLNKQLLIYLNRLSDLLFVLCRVLANFEGQSETLWRSDRLPE